MDMAKKFHYFATGHVCEQLMGRTLDDDTVETIAEIETDVSESAYNPS